ncbi:hypothetical protein P3X46_025514 [Hevea brasiliensis]|uniref:TF-B3 domain-containing protein n=2 Tax=Hevea brasiliensis TaxID=3981 RepID=A0ABQ9L5Y3_HEVBR|nr:B3 domain-containing protein At3g18960 [Hevea brasiliensis]KAJ9160080.1 hypothetical protein P3X46_025514 [Hevea brasiliensis]
MTSLGGRSQEETFTVRRKPTRFFKIILEYTIHQGKLGIPIKFVEDYGYCLTSPVTLQDPTGTSWKVELLKNGNEVWLEKGWPEFSENHTLKYGHLLVFEYKGDSLFHVFIFDKTAVEIEYSVKLNFDGESPQPKKQEIDDHDSISCHNLDDPIRNGNQSRGKRKQFMDETGRSRQAGRPKRSKICGALEAVNNFISSYPFFKVLLRRSLNVAIPFHLIRRYMACESRTVMLKVADKSWPVKLNVYSHRRTAKLCAGWLAFARENSLEVGDVCIFELIERNMLNAYIFRCAS